MREGGTEQEDEEGEGGRNRRREEKSWVAAEQPWSGETGSPAPALSSQPSNGSLITQHSYRNQEPSKPPPIPAPLPQKQPLPFKGFKGFLLLLLFFLSFFLFCFFVSGFLFLFFPVVVMCVFSLRTVGTRAQIM